MLWSSRAGSSNSASLFLFPAVRGKTVKGALVIVGLSDDLERPFPDLAQCLAKLVHGIAPAGEDVLQPRVMAIELGENKRRPFAILYVNRVSGSLKKITAGVGHDVALAPIDLLACIVTLRPSPLGGFGTLAVTSPYVPSITPVPGGLYARRYPA